jgi:hypothetical protein
MHGLPPHPEQNGHSMPTLHDPKPSQLQNINNTSISIINIAQKNSLNNIINRLMIYNNNINLQTKETTSFINHQNNNHANLENRNNNINENNIENNNNYNANS